MAQPFDYSPQLQNPLQGAMQAIQLGMALRDDRAQQAQAQAKAEQQKLMSIDLEAASRDPNPGAIARLSLKYPQLSEGFKRSYDMMADEAKQSNLSAMTQVYSAVNAEQPALAVDLLRKQSEAMKAAGKEREAQASTVLADLIERSPQHAKLTIGTALSGVMGPDKFAESFAKLGGEQRAQEQAPADLAAKQGGAAKAAAEAKTAAITAQYADSQAVADLTKKQWDVTKIVQDIGIAKEQNRIRAMEAAAAKEGNALKREELQLRIDETKRARDEKIREKTAEAENAIGGIDKSTGLIAEILGDEDSLRAAVGASGWRGWIPGTQARAMTGKLEQLQNAIAATNLDKLKGAMSDKDIMFLKSMETNLDRFQNEDQFIKEIRKIESTLDRAREVSVKKYGAEGSTLAEGETLYESHPQYGKVTTRRARQLALESGMSVDDVKRFLDERALQTAITDRVKGSTGIRPGQ